MAGHSKWANTRFRKAAQDQKRGKLFTKLIREITVASKQHGMDPDLNPRLRTAIDKALSNNLTRDAIDRAIQRASGNDAKNLVEVVYEGYAPFGIAVMVECLTDNHVRTVSNVRYCFSKHGGSLGVDGSVSYLFSKEGHIFIPEDYYNAEIIQQPPKIDYLMEIAIEAGAIDFNEDTSGITVVTAPKDFISIRAKLEDYLGKNISNSEIVTIANNYSKPESEQAAKKIVELLDSLEDLDDVQNVYSNADLTDLLQDP